MYLDAGVEGNAIAYELFEEFTVITSDLGLKRNVILGPLTAVGDVLGERNAVEGRVVGIYRLMKEQ